MVYPRSYLSSSYETYRHDHDMYGSSLERHRCAPQRNNGRSQFQLRFLREMSASARSIAHAQTAQERDYRTGEWRHRSRQPFSNVPSFSWPVGHQRDENMNYIFDEALNFVDSSDDILPRQRSEMCSEFISHHIVCAICLDVLIDSIVVPCGHKFCRYCIDTWLKIRSTCPICEKPINSRRRQYPDNQVTNSISHRFSEDWSQRRQVPQNEQDPQENVMHMSWNSEWWSTFKKKAFIGIRETFRIAKCIGIIGFNSLKVAKTKSVSAVTWLSENITLRDFVNLVLVGTVVVIIYYTGQEITNFLQFTSYSTQKYDRDIPLSGQLASLGSNRKKALDKKSKYREFAGPSDNIFANFIVLFYESF